MRKFGLLMVLLLALSVSGLAQAQDAFPVPCGGLSDADCEISQQSYQAQLDATSYRATFDADLNVENIPNVPVPISASITGALAFTGALSSLAMHPDDMAMMADPAAMVAYMSELLNAFDADLTLTINLPEILVAQSNGQVPASIPLEMRLVDGVAYLNFDSLVAIAGDDADGMPTGWQGVSLIEMFGMFEQAAAMGDMEMFSMPMTDMSMFEQFMDPDFINQYLTVERLEDTTAADGAAVAQFHTTFDYAGLLSSPEMRDLMTSMMQEQGSMTEDDLNMMMGMIGSIYEELNLEITQTIGLDDFLPRSMSFLMTWDMSALMIATRMDSRTGTEEPVESTEPAPALTVTFNMAFSDYNAVPEITAPEEATIVPLAAMMGGMGGRDMRGHDTDDMMPTAEATAEANS